MTNLNLPSIFVLLVGLVFPAIANWFFISSCSIKQDSLDSSGSNLILFFKR